MNDLDQTMSSKEPTFKKIFTDDWHDLPVVMHKHYANRPYSDDITIVEGKLDIMCAGPIKWCAPLFWLLRGVPPVNESNVPVTVTFKSSKENKEFTFHRRFQFKSRKPYEFQSRMLQVSASEVIEKMSFGIIWRMNYVWENDAVNLKHKGYGFNFFGRTIPLPLTFLLGEGNATETAIDDDNFAMQMSIAHPFWGKIYEYKGQFKIKKIP